MRHDSPMRARKNTTDGRTVVALATLVGLAVSACGDDGPTGPKPASLSDLFGNELYKADGSVVGISALNNVPLIGIYFANPECPACVAFTPVLVEAYDQLITDGKSFEVVLVALGINDAGLFNYMESSGMGWLAVLPRSSRAERLVQLFIR